MLYQGDGLCAGDKGAMLKFEVADPGKVGGFSHAAVHCRRLEYKGGIEEVIEPSKAWAVVAGGWIMVQSLEQAITRLYAGSTHSQAHLSNSFDRDCNQKA